MGAMLVRQRASRVKALVLMSALTSSACAQAPSTEPAAPTQRSSVDAASGAEQTRPGAALQTPAATSADISPVEPLAPDVAMCAPPASGVPWAEVARLDDDGNTYVLLEHADAGASASFDSAVVLLAEGGCEYEIVSGPGSGARSEMRRPSDDAWDELVDGSFTWHVAQSGGVEAFADVQRRAHGGTFAECAPGEERACVPTWLALRFRRAGVDVASADG